MSEFKDCPRCGRNHRHLKYCGWDVGKLLDHTANLERQLEAEQIYSSMQRDHSDQLERQLEEAREVQNKLGEWVHQYIHCMRTVDYCGSLEEANEMGRYLEQLKEQGE